VQRRGIGSALLRALATELAAGGCGAASLWVLKQNQAARRFYERRGGVLLAEVPGPNGRAGLAEVAYGWRDLVRL
jgi:ribosomal protein S18 acetylase RimI-like enzyme